MKPSELFGVLVRFAGLFIVFYGLYEILGGVDNMVENLIAVAQGNKSDQPSSLSYFAFGIPSLLVGALVFFLADWIVKLAYRRQMD